MRSAATAIFAYSRRMDYSGIITMVFFQNFGKCRGLPVIKQSARAASAHSGKML